MRLKLCEDGLNQLSRYLILCAQVEPPVESAEQAAEVPRGTACATDSAFSPLGATTLAAIAVVFGCLSATLRAGLSILAVATSTTGRAGKRVFGPSRPLPLRCYRCSARALVGARPTVDRRAIRSPWCAAVLAEAIGNSFRLSFLVGHRAILHGYGAGGCSLWRWRETSPRLAREGSRR